MDWKRIMGARSLIRSGFYSDPEISSAILDRCATRLLLDETMSDPAKSPVSQGSYESASALAR
jgi:hypothetical protein